MKIKEFKDLEGVTERGLTCRVRGREYKGVIPSYYSVSLEGKNFFQEGFYEGDDLQECIACLKEVGFYDIEIKTEDLRSLTEILKQYIKPSKFETGYTNFYFLIRDEGDVIITTWEDRDQVFGGLYFTFIEDNYNLLNDYLEENEVTIKQIHKSLKELGWL